MSLAVSIREVTEIINPANIVQWYNADDLTVGAGLATWNDRSSQADHLTTSGASRRGDVVLDANGFKHLFMDYGVAIKNMLSTLNTMNTDETVIAIINKVTIPTPPSLINLRVIQAGNLNNLSLYETALQQNSTDSVVGSGRFITNTSLKGKMIISFSRRVSTNPIMRNSIGFTISTGPFTNTVFPAANKQQFFASSAIFAGASSKTYEVLTINQYVDDLTLKALIRSMAFQKCIPI